MFDWDWRETLKAVLIFAGKNPWSFIYYILLCLSPFFALSAYLSWQLAKQIEAKEKEKKKKARREANIAKARRQKVD
jgi:predicted solute-binding protein